MSAWLDYRLSDFLMFSPRVYARLLESYNAAVWPLHVVALLSGLALLMLALRDPQRAMRPIALILATTWAWVAVFFLHQRYATINWAAEYVAMAFVVEAVWLAIVALRAPSCAVRGKAHKAVRRAGLGMLWLAVVFYPFLAMIQGRPWGQAHYFGLMPEPTLVATLGALLVWRGTFRWWGAIVPLVCCLASGATRWTLGEPDAWLLPVVAVTAFGALVLDGLREHTGAEAS